MHSLTLGLHRQDTAHHQRCTSCGATSRASTTRGAIGFRHKHRKACPEAEFERPWRPSADLTSEAPAA